MTDYKTAIKEGIKAAQQVDWAKREIDEVFKQLNQQLTEFFKGKIVIQRRSIERTKSVEELFSSPFGSTLKYDAIVALNTTIPDSKPRELASWSMDKMGYPCRISWIGQEHFCEDKEALENTLSMLLKEPFVGQVLSVLSKLEPKNENTKNKKPPLASNPDSSNT